MIIPEIEEQLLNAKDLNEFNKIALDNKVKFQDFTERLNIKHKSFFSGKTNPFNHTDPREAFLLK